jgi:L-lactate dehydrogenase complex protein LldG
VSARDAILDRLRAAQRTLHVPVTSELPPISPAVAAGDDSPARFARQADALGIECYLEPSTEDVQRRVRQVVGDRPALCWDPDDLPYAVARVLPGARFGGASRDEQAGLPIGVTGCDAAIAETASIVLFSGPGRSRTVSLLPPIHLAVVERSRLCATMADMFRRHRERFRDAASCTVITGPSRTADIELTLTLGIHGPGRVIVVIGP